MNPSYNAGGSSIPGAKPGVIASGPDPSDAKPGVIASGPDEQPSVPVVSPLSNKPAPMSLGGARRSSGGSKKWILIGAGVLIVALIVVLVVFAVMPKNGGGSGSITMNNNFNVLINYITSGTKTDIAVTGEYDVANDYYFLDGWNNEEEKTAVYAETKTLMDKFVNGYSDGENATLNNLVKSTKEQFDFVYAMDLSEKVSGIEVIKVGVEKQSDEAKRDLVNYYNFSSVGDNTYVNGFLEAYGAWLDAVLSEINLYKENGCVANGSINDSCMISKNDAALNDKMSEIFEKINDTYSYVNSYYHMAPNYVANIYDINTLLSGGSLEGVVDE